MKKIFLLLFGANLFIACSRDKDTPPVPIPTPAPVAFRILDSTQMVTDLELLSSNAFKGRKAGTPEVVLTHQLIQNRLRAAGVDSFATGFVQDFTAAGLGHKNFIGLVKGSTYPDKYIVVGAHFDHLGVNGSGAVYHGADDNASGTANILAMAKYFQSHKPAYSIIFALWDAEELFFLGSAHFVNNLPVGLDLSKIKFYLNLDMVARSDNNTIWACGLSHYPAYKYLVDSIAPKSATRLKSGYDKPSDPEDWTYRSDQASFHRKNIPFIFLSVEDHANYHQVTDTYYNINLNRYVENANLAAQMVLILDRKL